MRSPDWQFTRGDQRATVAIDLKGTDAEDAETAQVLAVDDTVAFHLQRSGRRGPIMVIEATVVDRGTEAESDVAATPARVSVDLPDDLEAGRYDSAFVVTFADGSKPLHWPNTEEKLFGRVWPGFIDALEDDGSS